MKGYVGNIEQLTRANEHFRQVLYTAKNCQLVVMSIPQGGDIGEETHNLDQFLRIETGEGKVVLDGVQHEIKDGFAIIIPAGTRHNVISAGSSALKLYSLYAPPNHKDQTIHKTKAEAEVSEEHFDGQTTE